MSTPNLKKTTDYEKHSQSCCAALIALLNVLLLTVFFIPYSDISHADDLKSSIAEQSFLKQNSEWVVGYVDVGLGSEREPISFNYGNELLTA
ncbi:hypothetical protein QCD83_26205 [Pseudomonas savastanoi pv. phaseolicola]|nr:MULTISPECIES: hypothetical protein [Pseudomonas]MDG6382299.1 hypothetical protein [Pseudomonas savastanoi pv. phaseolicola]MDG6392656.1 hypothetical protein [Pseudomonas savastanoi pv. phaseolicola]QDV99151.1 hypothetical protein FFH21_003960 [Pseudomonas sp. KBS0707]